MAASEGTGIETLLGDHIALVADTYPIDEYTLERRAFFEEKGISFPSEDTERLLVLWEAKKAIERGSVYLSSDGSVVDPGDFTDSDAKYIFLHKQLDLDNKDKLKLFVRLEFIAKAGALAIENIVAVRGSDHPSIKPAQDLLRIQKNYSQLLMALENWEQPWQDTVATEFDGPTLTFPVSLEDIEYTHPLFTAIPLFRDIQTSTLVGKYMENTKFMVERSLREKQKDEKPSRETDDRNLGAAIIASLYYRHSPEASREFIQKYITSTNNDIDWVHEIEYASQRTGENLYSKKNNN